MAEDADDGDHIEHENAMESGDISILNSLVGHGSPRSLQLWGVLGSGKVHVLIDNGSTHNFVQPGVVPSTLPPHRSIDHRIHLFPNTKPVNVRPYRYPHYQKGEMEKLVNEMLSQGTIVRDHEFYVKKTKCVFGAATLEYLGHIISNRGVEWGGPEDVAFSALKDRLTHAPILCLPNFEDTFVIEADASLVVGYWVRLGVGWGYGYEGGLRIRGDEREVSMSTLIVHRSWIDTNVMRIIGDDSDSKDSLMRDVHVNEAVDTPVIGEQIVNFGFYGRDCSPEEAFMDDLSEFQSTYPSYQLKDKLNFEGEESVTPVLQQVGRPIRTKSKPIWHKDYAI
ncbi:hypothetical protein Tco_0657548 [Tanacetum coccineum]